MMEKKLVIVPFDLELAKRITNGEAEGRIITRVGNSVRILCFDVTGNKYKICALLHYGKSEDPEVFTEKGLLYDNQTDDLDLMLEIPEYMTFKDGDVIAFGHTEKSLAIGIFHRSKSYKSHECYVKLDWSGGLVYDVEPLTYNNARYATEEEKQRLIKALKESSDIEAKECLKILGIEQKQEYEFKPFDKVLVRDYDDGVWKADIFFNNSDGCYMCTGNVVWAQCIPYNEQTAHLLGTNKDCKE